MVKFARFWLFFCEAGTQGVLRALVLGYPLGGDTQDNHADSRNQIRDFGDFALNLFSILGIGSIDDNYQVITSVVPAQFRGD